MIAFMVLVIGAGVGVAVVLRRTERHIAHLLQCQEDQMMQDMTLLTQLLQATARGIERIPDATTYAALERWTRDHHHFEAVALRAMRAAWNQYSEARRLYEEAPYGRQ